MANKISIEQFFKWDLDKIEPRKLERILAGLEKNFSKVPESMYWIFTPHTNYCPFTSNKYETIHESMKPTKDDPREDAFRCKECGMLVGPPTRGYQLI